MHLTVKHPAVFKHIHFSSLAKGIDKKNRKIGKVYRLHNRIEPFPAIELAHIQQ